MTCGVSLCELNIFRNINCIFKASKTIKNFLNGITGNFHKTRIISQKYQHITKGGPLPGILGVRVTIDNQHEVFSTER